MRGYDVVVISGDESALDAVRAMLSEFKSYSLEEAMPDRWSLKYKGPDEIWPPDAWKLMEAIENVGFKGQDVTREDVFEFVKVDDWFETGDIRCNCGDRVDIWEPVYTALDRTTLPLHDGEGGVFLSTGDWAVDGPRHHSTTPLLVALAQLEGSGERGELDEDGLSSGAFTDESVEEKETAVQERLPSKAHILTFITNPATPALPQKKPASTEGKTSSQKAVRMEATGPAAATFEADVAAEGRGRKRGQSEVISTAEVVSLDCTSPRVRLMTSSGGSYPYIAGGGRATKKRKTTEVTLSMSNPPPKTSASGSPLDSGSLLDPSAMNVK